MNTLTKDVEKEQSNFISGVYGWMSLALVVTGLVAWWVSSNPNIYNVVVGKPFVFYGILIAQLGLVGYISAMINRMSASIATIVFLAYAALNGFTFSLFFQLFTSESIGITFLITAATFCVMSLYGALTKTDLTRVGNLAFMSLIGLIIAGIVNLFFYNDVFYSITTYVGIIVFVALIAYDTQRIKSINVPGNEGTEAAKKESIIGALTLYLDFINLFQYFLRIFGTRKND